MSDQINNSQNRYLQELIAFEQNDEGLHDLHVGDKVSVEWDPEHTFGLDGSQDINAGADLDEEE